MAPGGGVAVVWPELVAILATLGALVALGFLTRTRRSPPVKPRSGGAHPERDPPGRR